MSFNIERNILMKNIAALFLCLTLISRLFSQTIPAERRVDWTKAGLSDAEAFDNLPRIDAATFGVVAGGVAANDSAVAAAIASLAGNASIIQFPAGEFLFHETINLPSGAVLRGAGADKTTFLMNLGGKGHSISVAGKAIESEKSPLAVGAKKGDSAIVLENGSIFSAGDWILLSQNDSALVFSDWARNSVGQILRVVSVRGDTLLCASELRHDFPAMLEPSAKNIAPAENSGVECLKLLRLDDTSPSQTSAIHFRYCANCRVKAVESEMCLFSHVEAEYCANLLVEKSYFHRGFDYGGGGRAYGVALQYATGECLIQDNIFERLRHSMLVQAGANGNVFAYNFSTDPYWDSGNPLLPENSAGEIVLHGNWVHSNLFEQNIVQNIVVDNSHGANGPRNTFFRNRAEGYGIFFSASNSPNQNIVGNDITNTKFPYSLVNYQILGEGHFVYGNRDKGALDPPGTEDLPELSYAFKSAPDFVPAAQFGAIGTPNETGASIPALVRYDSGDFFADFCDSEPGEVERANFVKISLSPNPAGDFLTISGLSAIEKIEIVDIFGRVAIKRENVCEKIRIDLSTLPRGTYLVYASRQNGKIRVAKFVKL